MVSRLEETDLSLLSREMPAVRGLLEPQTGQGPGGGQRSTCRRGSSSSDSGGPICAAEMTVPFGGRKVGLEQLVPRRVTF